MYFKIMFDKMDVSKWKVLGKLLIISMLMVILFRGEVITM